LRRRCCFTAAGFLPPCILRRRRFQSIHWPEGYSKGLGRSADLVCKLSIFANLARTDRARLFVRNMALTADCSLPPCRYWLTRCVAFLRVRESLVYQPVTLWPNRDSAERSNSCGGRTRSLCRHRSHSGRRPERCMPLQLRSAFVLHGWAVPLRADGAME
jgi:hypothetical protein